MFQFYSNIEHTLARSCTLLLFLPIPSSRSAHWRIHFIKITWVHIFLSVDEGEKCSFVGMASALDPETDWEPQRYYCLNWYWKINSSNHEVNFCTLFFSYIIVTCRAAMRSLVLLADRVSITEIMDLKIFALLSLSLDLFTWVAMLPPQCSE